MKRILAVLGIFSFSFFIGCGGDSATPPPMLPNMNSPNNLAALQDLMAQAMKAKQSCAKDYTPLFASLAQAAQKSAAGPGAPQAPGGGMAAMLPMLMGGMGGGGAPGGAPGAPQGGQCNNDIGNLLMAFSTIMIPGGPGGAASPYANNPQARQWLQGVLGGITARIGQAIQQTTGINIAANPALQQQLLAVASNIVQTQVIPGLGGGLAGQAASAFGQFAGGNSQATPALGIIPPAGGQAGFGQIPTQGAPTTYANYPTFSGATSGYGGAGGAYGAAGGNTLGAAVGASLGGKAYGITQASH